MSICLTEQEIVDLTGGKVQSSAQSSVLTFLGIEHKRRPDGSVLVLRDALATAKVQPRAREEFKVNYG